MKSRRHITTFILILVLALTIKFQMEAVSTGNPVDQQAVELDQTELIVPLITSSNVIIDGSISDSEYGMSFTDTQSSMEVYWEHDGTDFIVGLVSPGTGWISIGIGDKMKNSNMIIGGVNGTSQYCLDVFGLSGHQHSNDTDNGGSYDILDYSVSETVSSTTLEFIIPLDTGDTLDPILEMGIESYFFLAFSQNNDSLAIQDHSLAPRSDSFKALVEAEVQDYDESIPLSMESNVTVDGTISENEYTADFIDDLTGIEIYWEHNSTIISFGLVSPGLGWVALGIGESMFQSSMYMGGFADGSSYCVDTDGIGQIAPVNDADTGGIDDIISCEASETEIKSTFEFTIPFTSLDPLDENLDIQSVYTMFFAYHESDDDITQIHTAYSLKYKILIMPEADRYDTFLTFDTETVVEFDQTLFFEVTLTNETGGELAGIVVEFYRKTQFGRVVFNSSKTDSEGKANAIYFNPYLLYEHTFGAKSKELVDRDSEGELFTYLSSESEQVIKFNEKIEHDQRAENIKLTRIGLLVAFWVVGIVIWGGFGYTFYQMIQIFKGRNEEIEEIVKSQTDTSLEGGNTE